MSSPPTAAGAGPRDSSGSGRAVHHPDRGGEWPVCYRVCPHVPDLPARRARLLHSAGRSVGYFIAGLVSILHPAAVVVSTGIRGAEDLVLSAVRQCVYERAPPAATRGLVIGTCQLGRDDGAVGAAEFACRAMVSYRCTDRWQAAARGCRGGRDHNRAPHRRRMSGSRARVDALSGWPWSVGLW